MYRGGIPPEANSALTPSIRNPHLEQNLTSPEACCCPHFGQYMLINLAAAAPPKGLPARDVVTWEFLR